ncbi:NAD(P)/FAD-dependent oxidoreductase [Methanolobus halotolerans]|uniref:NAD(P)/FAD-dependent oxidoreductase n=1 Tax=Methanolobus halotolerans TaxID=2052935 RepID=A0A4E0PZY1_9EURY|nr:NAD(P)/FAD-dependent oxidoreductase [Methanolobus halotolerans]TGC11326.1 NAD(P)/FAD-dependent oxidoreductase [Methanolobus halotolerans]
MKNTDYDVVVVGAGPVGSTAARYAVNNGATVLMIEDHASIGSPVGCTGLLSTRALSECEVLPSDSFVLNKVRGAFVYPMSGACLPIDGKETKAYVVSRKNFDRTLASMALDSGVELKLNTRATGLDNIDGVQKLSIIENGQPGEIRAKVVIGADGVRSRVARMAGLGQVKKILPGIQIEAPYKSPDVDYVELFVGSQAPGFFGWTVPVNENISRIGLAIDCRADENVRTYLDRMLKNNDHIASRYEGGHLDLVIGGIPLGPPDKTYAEGTLITGDAAGQVKPTSGGGIYTGVACARIAGEVAARAALEEDNSAQRLAEYDCRWRAKIGRELAIGMNIHNFIGGRSDSEMDELIASMNKPPILDTITTYGDMDHPSIVIKKLLRPSNSRHLLGVFRAFAKTVLWHS